MSGEKKTRKADKNVKFRNFEGVGGGPNWQLTYIIQIQCL